MKKTDFIKIDVCMEGTILAEFPTIEEIKYMNVYSLDYILHNLQSVNFADCDHERAYLLAHQSHTIADIANILKDATYIKKIETAYNVSIDSALLEAMYQTLTKLKTKK